MKNHNDTKNSRKKVAVFFGGRSPEHDVSVVSGLQVLAALDQNLYDAHPVYITTDGRWLYGHDALRSRDHYMMSESEMDKMTEWLLDSSCIGKLRLVSAKKGMFSAAKSVEFDVVLPVFHGLYGEDGNIQGLCEVLGVPYAGMRTMASAVLMDKVATKRILAGSDVPMLPYAVIKRPDEGYLVAEDVLKDILGDMSFPFILKPAHLGSSIGIAKVNTIEELRASLPAIFEIDDTAIIEPFVEHLVEYNVAVSKALGEGVSFSAIERPKTSEELLDFKAKYLSGGDDKSGNKLGQKSSAPVSEGMLSLTRDINPEISSELDGKIKKWAAAMFNAVDGTGAPRIDFIGNSETGELWLNEVNPLPGSFGYFLWEAAENSIFFTDFLTGLLKEAFAENNKRALPKDPVPEAARLLKRA